MAFYSIIIHLRYNTAQDETSVHLFPCPLPIPSHRRLHTHRSQHSSTSAFLYGSPVDQSAPRSRPPPRHGSERDADPRHKVADAGGVPRVPEGDVLAAGQRVQVRPPGQELPGGERPSDRLLRFAQGELESERLASRLFYRLLRWQVVPTPWKFHLSGF